jgi:hypothetical protein
MLRPEGPSTFSGRLADDVPLPSSAEGPRFVIQREKDLVREIEENRKSIEASKVEHDRLVFLCNRLAERNRKFNKKITESLSERDSAVIDKCQNLHNVTIEPEREELEKSPSVATLQFESSENTSEEVDDHETVEQSTSINTFFQRETSSNVTLIRSRN